jgi:hypothetical protein
LIRSFRSYHKDFVSGVLTQAYTLLSCDSDASCDYEVHIYRKPTHTDQYLSFTSNLHLQHKRSVVRSLLNRVDKIVTEKDDRVEERSHVQAVLKDNRYEQWMFKLPDPKPDKTPTSTDRPARSRSYPIPYVRGVSENMSKIVRRYGVTTYFKPFNTIRSQLVRPKDKTSDLKKCGIIYELKCSQCEATYVGETSRALETRLKEHKRQKGTLTAVGEHLQQTGHKLTEDSKCVLARQDSFWPRKKHEAIEIRERGPTLNRDTGYHLPAIYNTLLSCDSNVGSHDWEA